ncbi:MAG: type II secretion system GspH family protein [Bacilli bacterium]|nr:type II secretion system GspH family protein [Bacilli bacterium]
MKKSCKKKKRKNSLKKIFKGFTLVELLAVIVILAIIMLITIPAILDSLESARKKTFIEFATKTYDSSIKVRFDEELNNSSLQSCVIYNIKNDLNLSNTGDYNGYVLYTNINNVPKYYIVLYDKNYIIGPALYNDENFNVNKLRRYNNESDDNLKSALALEGECINYTNKGDGSKGSSISEDGIYNKLKVDNYVHYYPSKNIYTLDDKLTGCAETDECDVDLVNPSSTTLWIVTSVNDDGTVTIASRSNERIHLWGLTGYKNSVHVLKDVARAYGDNNKFAKSIKTLGEDISIDTLDDEMINGIRNACKSSSACHVYLSKNYVGEDDSVIEFSKLTTRGKYFLEYTFVAGRHKNADASWSNGVMVYYIGVVDDDGFFQHSRMDGVYGNPIFADTYGCATGTYPCKFMKGPIEGYEYGYVSILVTLKANVKVASGSGTQADPYELTF